MKKTVPAKKRSVNYLPVSLLALSCTIIAGSLYASNGAIGEKGTAHYAILVNKSDISKNNNIRLYTDASGQKILFSTNTENKKKYQVFVFDMYSKLVKQETLSSQESVNLQNLPKGNYLYQVFNKDEQVQCGQLTIN